MSYRELITNLGFTGDPFAKTNADEEELLDHYFIDPPFFPAVYGDVTEPKSSIVFAPQGGGKTALKRKIEIMSRQESVLCVTYNKFDMSGEIRRLEDVAMSFHLDNVIKLILVGVISQAAQVGVGHLTSNDRGLLYLMIKEYFSKIDRVTLREAISSVQNVSDAMKDWWNNVLGPISIVMNLITKRIGMDKVEVSKFEDQGSQSVGNQMEKLRLLSELNKKLGHRAIYVLIDKVDEHPLTAKASNSYKFIEPMLTNLQLLELSGYGFKFFLWDLMLEDYRELARPDRVKYYSLKWTRDQLREMLSRRLMTYSRSTVNSLKAICDGTEDIDDIVSLFGQGSPRIVINLCKEILDQQSEVNSSASRISRKAIIRAFDVFAENNSNERYRASTLHELMKVRRLDFTINFIYNDIFKVSQQAGLAKVRSWQDIGLVSKIGEIQENEKSRASFLYGHRNFLVAKYIRRDLDVFEFIGQKIKVCPRCGQILLRDWDSPYEQRCQECQEIVNPTAPQSTNIAVSS